MTSMNMHTCGMRFESQNCARDRKHHRSCWSCCSFHLLWFFFHSLRVRPVFFLIKHTTDNRVVVWRTNVCGIMNTKKKTIRVNRANSTSVDCESRTTTEFAVVVRLRPDDCHIDRSFEHVPCIHMSIQFRMWVLFAPNTIDWMRSNYTASLVCIVNAGEWNYFRTMISLSLLVQDILMQIIVLGRSPTMRSCVPTVKTLSIRRHNRCNRSAPA